MSWKFELLMRSEGDLITEGSVWTGEEILFTHIRKNRILRFDVKTNAIGVWREAARVKVVVALVMQPTVEYRYQPNASLCWSHVRD